MHVQQNVDDEINNLIQDTKPVEISEKRKCQL